MHEKMYIELVNYESTVNSYHHHMHPHPCTPPTRGALAIPVMQHVVRLVTFPGLRQRYQNHWTMLTVQWFSEVELRLSKPVVLGIDLRNRAAQGKDFLKV